MGKIIKNFTMLTMSILMASCQGSRPLNLGIKEGHLAPCPERPSCVSSQETTQERKIDSINYNFSHKEALERITTIIKNFPGAQIILLTDDYIHAEFSSSLFKFVDDVEFYFPRDKNIIHIRSAARKGYTDFGVNKERAYNIIFHFHQFNDVKKN